MGLKKQLKNDRVVVEKVLKYYGVDVKIKGNSDCITSRHKKNSRGSLSIQKKDGFVCACHCGLSGDVFKVVEQMEGITNFNDQLKRVCEIIGVEPVEKCTPSSNKTISDNRQEMEEIKKTYNFTNIAKDLHANIGSTNYFKSRCITHKLQEEYKLGYNVDGLNYIIKNYPGVLEEKGNDYYKQFQYFIPSFNVDGEIDYILARRNDGLMVPFWLKGKPEKVHNLKGYGATIFNLRYLQNIALTSEYIFVVEGWADALSLEALGYSAIALNSTSNVNKFIEELQKNKDIIKNKSFIIAGDNDPSGLRMNEKLIQFAQKEDINIAIFPLVKKYNDINNYLIRDKSSLEIDLKNFIISIKKVETIKKKVSSLSEKNNVIPKVNYINKDIRNMQMKDSIDFMTNLFKDTKLVVTYDKYISEFIEFITEVLTSYVKSLIISEAGGGKTYTMIAIARMLIKEEGTYVIMACPNSVQCEQNFTTYGVAALIGGTKVSKRDRIICCVYDKVLETVESVKKLGAKKIILVVDEAHHLIDSQNFRGGALRQFEEIDRRGLVDNTIHMTATPLGLFENDYNKIVEFQRNKKYNNIKNTFIYETKGGIENIANLVYTNHKAEIKNNPLSIVRCQSIKKCLKLAKLLILKGLKVSILNSDNKKTNKIFKEISNKSMITAEFDVVLTTSVLDCGTNINNNGVDRAILAYYATNGKNDFMFNSIKQFSARFRGELAVSQFYIFISNDTDKKYINYNEMYSKELKKVEIQADRVSQHNTFMKNHGYTKEITCQITNFELNLRCVDDEINSMGCIGYNELNGEIFINYRALRQKISNEYQTSFYNKSGQATQILKSMLNTKTISRVKIKLTKDSEITNLTKEMKQQDKEQKELDIILFKKKLEEGYKTYGDTFDEIINNEVVGEHIETVIKYREELKGLICYEQFTTRIKGLLQIGFKIGEIVEIVMNSVTYAELDKIILMEQNKNFALAYKKNPEYLQKGSKAKREYYLIRKTLNEVEVKQGRITEKLLINICYTLSDDGLSKIYKKNKQGEAVADTKRLMEKLKCIYVMKDSNCISSIVK
ncbi:toprim domain-containing protein [Clostridium estertheticum]|uniref:toprim domain-containing protein n=1 Tax=Clostridium estertheticum TaxID=238834 RepID=UPI001C0B5567|nr:toprim domain-containing protein [Clostridium estertheticum]MBU3200303.1 toprim domain-containing protein [Clostridium estertheticum]WAG64475.1 toprim domain-containing protein [Clostridium estertheticum]